MSPSTPAAHCPATAPDPPGRPASAGFIWTGTGSWIAAPGCLVRRIHIGEIARVTGWRCTTTPAVEKSQAAFCLSFVHAGAYRLRHRHGDGLVDAASWVLMTPGAPYETSHPFGCCDHGSAVVLRDDVAQSLLAEAGHDPAFGVAHDPAASGASSAFVRHAQLLRGVRDGALDALAADEAAIAVFAAALRPRRSRPAVAPRDRERVAAVREALQQRLAERVTLDELAAVAGVTPEHLCRRFRAVTGTSVARHLAQLRLRAALARLADEPAVDLTALALDVGFSSHSHFTWAFRREFGAPPSRLLAGDASRSQHVARTLARDVRAHGTRRRGARSCAAEDVGANA